MENYNDVGYCAPVAERPLLTGEYIVLSTLALRAMHGYEMLCFLEEEGLLVLAPIEQSTLYTYLRNVEARGFVQWNEERVGPRPPRKTFQLTEQGRDLVSFWLRQPVLRMREIRLEFLLKLYFLERLDPPAHQHLLAQQIEACQQYLTLLDQGPADSLFTRLVAQSKRSAAEGTLGWLRSYANELNLEGRE